jgi:hypothetical protein
MRTTQVSIGEIIESMYDELLELYGDKELALLAAQALGDELLAEQLRPAPVRRSAPPNRTLAIAKARARLLAGQRA